MPDRVAQSAETGSPSRAELLRAEQRAHEAEMFAADAATRALEAERAAARSGSALDRLRRELEEEIATRRRESDDLMDQIQVLEAERDAAVTRGAEIEAVARRVYGSVSWRVTRPLRSAKDAVRGRD